MRIPLRLVIVFLLPLFSVAGRPAPSEVIGRLPLAFEPNLGQTDARVKFLAHSPWGTVFLTSSEVVLSLRGAAAANVVRLSFPGSRRRFRLEGVAELPGHSNYFRGADPRGWRTRAPHYARVLARGLYPGIDALIHGNGKHLEYDFLVAPGADASLIRLRFRGAGAVRLDAAGNLVLSTATGELLHRKPVAYQGSGERRRYVRAGYVLMPGGDVGFRLGEYDRREKLIIDPVIGFSTFLGGSGLEQGLGIAVDSQGNVYVAGTTQSVDFPTTTGASQPDYNAGQLPGDAFVTKLTPDGAGLVYSTYLGGSRADIARAITVDGQGNVYVAGETDSTDFPTSVDAYQPRNHSTGVYAEGFLAKLDASGANIVYSTYLGGTFTDRIYALAVDAEGNAYVAGSTDSGLFPTTPAAFQITCPGYGLGGFVAKFNPAGTGLAYSTLVCGSANDEILGIAVNSQGNAYIAGVTSSPDFPVTTGPFGAPAAGSDENGFLASLAADGESLIYSTLIGGSGPDAATAVAIDGAGNAYVTGHTRSVDFPVTAGALQPNHADGGLFEDAFLTVLDAAGTTMLSSTYLGGSGQDRANAVTVDGAGAVYLTGFTESPDFPVTPVRCETGYRGRRDAFITKLSSKGTALDYSLFLGGIENDTGRAVAVGGGDGKVYVAGETTSPNFVTTEQAFRSAYRSGYAGAGDAFVARVDDGPPPSSPCVALNGLVNGGSFLPGPVAPGEIVSFFGAGLGPATSARFALHGDTIDSELAGTRVLFDGAPAPLIAASDGQVNAIVPYSVRIGETTAVQVEYQGVKTAELTLPVAASAPALFTLNVTGRGPGAILNQDYSVNTKQNPAAKGSVIQIFATGEGQTTPGGVDGKVAIETLPKPVLPVSVTIGGIDAPVKYAGAAPTLVAGVIQINAEVPAKVASGSAVPVVIKIGESASPPGVTVAIQ